MTLISSTDSSVGQSQPSSSGVYSLHKFFAPIEEEVLTNSNIDGVALRVDWGRIEVDEGVFDWRYLDSQIDLAKRNNKKVSIYFKAGNSNVKLKGLPDWLINGYPEMKLFSYYYYNPSVGCDSLKRSECLIVFAAPWDPIYLEKWLRFIDILSIRYGNETIISHIRGASQSILSGWELYPQIYDRKQNPVTFSDAGFTETKLVNSAKLVVDSFIRSFPNAVLLDEPLVIKPWSEIPGSNGSLGFSREVVNYGFSNYPSRYHIWHEFLNACLYANPSAPPRRGVLKGFWDNPGRSGMQMLWNVQDCVNDKVFSCWMNRKDCVNDEDGDGDIDKADVLRKAVDKALIYGMTYIEIYKEDVLDPELSDILEYAQGQLD